MHGGSGLLIRVRTEAWECINFPLCIMARGCRRLMDQTSYSSTSSNPGSVCKPPGSVLETICEPGKRDIGTLQWYLLLVLPCLQRLDKLFIFPSIFSYSLLSWEALVNSSWPRLTMGHFPSRSSIFPSLSCTHLPSN